MASVCGIAMMMNRKVQAFEKKSIFSETKWKKYSALNKKNLKCTSVAMEEKKKSMVFMTSDFNDIGKMVKGGLVYRQNLMIRSFDIGFDRTISLTALMSYLQDTALNHGTMMGVFADGEDLGITKEMSRNDLIWVISSLQLQLHHYPSWLDVVEVETWMYPSGQNGFGHDWIIRDTITGHTLAQATSVSVLMNKKTRKLSKMSKEIREEMAPHVIHCSPIFRKDTHRFPKQLDLHTTDFIRAGLKPGWDDLDVNQHVNNTKYINWILESVPRSLMKHHQLSYVSLKFRRECNNDDELHSLSKFVTNAEFANDKNMIELEHLLRLENGPEIVGGRTIWKPKFTNDFNTKHHKEPPLIGINEEMVNNS